ncbi:MAG: hypothetical protein WC423_26800 [Vulcanimicrobiota bacterium]
MSDETESSRFDQARLTSDELSTLIRGLRLSRTGLVIVLIADLIFVVFLVLLLLKYLIAEYGASKTGASVDPGFSLAYFYAKLLVALVPLIPLWGQLQVIRVAGLRAGGKMKASLLCLGLSIPARIIQDHTISGTNNEFIVFFMLLGPLLLHGTGIVFYMLYLVDLSHNLGAPELASRFQRLLLAIPATGLLLLLGWFTMPASMLVLAPALVIVIAVVGYISLSQAISRLLETPGERPCSRG